MTETQHVLDEAEDDTREELLVAIADDMATLSEASEAPNDVPAASTTFSSSEVDFDSDAWLHQFIEVQGWLNIEELSADSRVAFFTALVSQLSLNPADAIEDTTGIAELTTEALAALHSRIQLAVRLQSGFLQSREQGDSLSTATEDWAAAWEEQATDDEPTNPQPVRAKAEVWPIQALAKGKLNLTPSYQRGDVWNNNDRSALIESILRGIPLPSIILLRNKAPKPREVVDGKQRLTAILRFVGTHPIARQKIEDVAEQHPDAGFDTLFHENYPAFKKLWKNKMGETLTAKVENEYYFPFRLRGSKESALIGTDLQGLKGKYYTQVKDETITVAEQELSVQELFEEPADYKIPVIEYTHAERRQIHEVFKLYNKQGVHLNAEEIRNAVYHEVELTRALLFAAGDADRRRDVSDVAPALADVAGLERISRSLTGYKFGVTRYKRTKVLAWMISVLVFDPGKPFASTATHINQMLADLQEHSGRPLLRAETIADLFTWIGRAIDLHASFDELWAAEFMGGKRSGSWQELQLVGSLVGVALATITRPDDIEDLIESKTADIRKASESRGWRRPKKTQTKDQWDYIARLARDILDTLGIDGAAASQIVRDRFGSSGYEQLQDMIVKSKDT
ncbi:DUF262 domain-containing protein [Ornithinimicrobium pratense]|uniref:DUF262 domain-containing protein n=1 Tax=Ornithinimicrobium pratense TaxID=2593973 RepID=A0A5J6V2W9_9MICO|nr:DUF262 domain-containing protein [Ornithinimicrobium pratense]QFG68075.1 DUF262 domain-containing protein [Ornithinimicrobium pratense]